MTYYDHIPNKCPICNIGDLSIEHHLDLKRCTCQNPKCMAQFDLKWYPVKNNKKFLILAQINPQLLSELASADLSKDDTESLTRHFTAISKHGLYSEFIAVGLV